MDSDHKEKIYLERAKNELDLAQAIFKLSITNKLKLEFELKEGKLIDNSGSEWSFDGASEGDGSKQLKRIDSFGVYWFSWLATYPDTELFF